MNRLFTDRNVPEIYFPLNSFLQMCIYIKLNYNTFLVKFRQILGILGIVLAVSGGIAWFFQEKLPAIMLWGTAALILFRINKVKKRRK